jgi:hypothetical protein
MSAVMSRRDLPPSSRVWKRPKPMSTMIPYVCPIESVVKGRFCRRIKETRTQPTPHFVRNVPNPPHDCRRSHLRGARSRAPIALAFGRPTRNPISHNLHYRLPPNSSHHLPPCAPPPFFPLWADTNNMPPAKKSAAKKAPAKKTIAKKAPAKKSAGKKEEKKEKVKRAPSAYNLFMKSELAKVKKVCDPPHEPRARCLRLGRSLGTPRDMRAARALGDPARACRGSRARAAGTHAYPSAFPFSSMDACRGHDHHAREGGARTRALGSRRLPAACCGHAREHAPRPAHTTAGLGLPALSWTGDETYRWFPLTRPPLPASPPSASLAHPWQANPKLDHKEAFTTAAGNWSKQKK